MNKKKATTFKDFKLELLRDTEVRKQYSRLKPKYKKIANRIRREADK
jgi:hypothetical protein